jgi:hypothetical protein
MVLIWRHLFADRRASTAPSTGQIEQLGTIGPEESSKSRNAWAADAPSPFFFSFRGLSKGAELTYLNRIGSRFSPAFYGTATSRSRPLSVMSCY